MSRVPDNVLSEWLTKAGASTSLTSLTSLTPHTGEGLALLRTNRYLKYAGDADGADGADGAEVAVAKNNDKSYGWAFVDLPEAAKAAMAEMRAKIAPEDLNEDGLEDNPHITVLYGITGTGDNLEAVKKALAEAGPGTGTLGKASLFSSEKADVLKVSVTSEALGTLHDKLATVENEDKFPTYTPHATLAYLKPGTGKKYVDLDNAEGIEFTFDKVFFENAQDERWVISLTREMDESDESDESNESEVKTASTTAADYAPGLPSKTNYGDILGTLKPGDVTDFVIQKHDTVKNPTRPHYDMRMGTPVTQMYSFAIPKARMPEGAEKLLAVQTQLHRPSYNHFTGDIGHGYGAGHVSRVELGKATVDHVSPNSLHFTIGGTENPRSYRLIHIKGAKGTSWLLMGRGTPGTLNPGKPIIKRIDVNDMEGALAQAVGEQEGKQ